MHEHADAAKQRAVVRRVFAAVSHAPLCRSNARHVCPPGLNHHVAAQVLQRCVSLPVRRHRRSGRGHGADGHDRVFHRPGRDRTTSVCGRSVYGLCAPYVRRARGPQRTDGAAVL